VGPDTLRLTRANPKSEKNANGSETPEFSAGIVGQSRTTSNALALPSSTPGSNPTEEKFHDYSVA